MSSPPSPHMPSEQLHEEGLILSHAQHSRVAAHPSPRSSHADLPSSEPPDAAPPSATRSHSSPSPSFSSSSPPSFSPSFTTACSPTSRRAPSSPLIRFLRSHPSSHLRLLTLLALTVLLALGILSLLPSSTLLSTIKPSSSSLFVLPWSRSSPPPFHALTLAHLVTPPRTAHQYQQFLKQHQAELDSALLWQRSYDALSIEWQARLNPIRVEALEGYVGVVVNSMVLTGAAHYPPLFKALPCIVEGRVMSVNATAHFPHGECEYAALAPAVDGQLSIVVTIYEGVQGAVVRQEVHPAVLTAEHLQRMQGEERKRDALQQYMHTCPEIALMMGGGVELDVEQDGDGDVASSPCPLSTAAELVSALVAPVTHRFWFDRLSSERVYTFSVQYTNGTHVTAPFHSKRVSIQAQLALYDKEQRRVTRYFNHITQPYTTAAAQQAHKLDGEELETEALREILEQQTSSSNPLKLAVPSSHRSVAPFEAARISEADSLCPSTFHAKVADYRQWHAEQVARLLAVRDSPAALRALLTTDPHPIRIIVNQANLRSGVSDRTHGLLGSYLTAMLTRRVLLMADDWPDIYLSMQPSLQLNSALIAPHLNHSLLADLNRVIPMSLAGLALDELDAAYPTPITWITSIRGMQVKLLTASREHGPTLQRWGLRVPTIVGCVYHSLWMVRLSTLISHSGYAAPFATLLHRTSVGIGIQIRTWDDGAFDMQSDQNGKPHHKQTHPMLSDNSSSSTILTHQAVHGYFHCAHDVSDSVRERGVAAGREVKPVWLLMADDVHVRRAAVHKWGSSSSSHVLLTLQIPSLLGHSSLGDPALQLLYQQHALVEQYLFSLCEHHVISKYSGFGRLPAVLGMRQRPVFGMDYREEVRKTAVCMDEHAHGLDIAALAADNSWL